VGERFRVDEGGAARIREVFERTFSRWELQLPAGAIERAEAGGIQRAGWTVRYIFGADDEGSYLEYYATHRMTNDTRVRIYGSGRSEELDAIWEFASWDPTKPGDEERANREYREHNQRLAEELKRLGLYPSGDINAFLRTEGLPDGV
jgi:hypothetical protein